MLTYDDVLALSDLTAEEVEAIAHHEHIPEICAAELGAYLILQPDGIPRIKRIILDDIEEAEAAGRTERVKILKGVLLHFLREHRARS
jgi:hypothetical protein